MKMKFIILSALIFFALLATSMTYADDKTQAKCEMKVNELVAQFAHLLSNKFDMRMMAQRVVMTGEKGDILSIFFQKDPPFSREALRSFLVSSSNELLTMINSNEEVKAHLGTNPLTIDNIHIYISIFNAVDKGPDDTNMETGEFTEGKLRFETITFVRSEGKEKDIQFSREERIESYDEAVKLLQQVTTNN